MKKAALCIAAVIMLIIFSELALGGEKLYNGIELPDKWPPTRTVEELRMLEPMAVPYLKNPPKVITIDVGRQLFVDDFLIEKTDFKRKFYGAQMYEGNPILKPELHQEKWSTFGQVAMPFSGGVWWDPADKIFKMWYSGGNALCYATSKDGLKWEKPILDVIARTNIVYLPANWDSSVIWLDLETKDATQRYKMFMFHRDAWLASVNTSADGIHWSKPLWTGPSGDRSTMFYNPFRKVWVFSIRAFYNNQPWLYTKPDNIIGRANRYWEGKDFLKASQWTGESVYTSDNWKEGQPAFWMAADKLDSSGGKGDDGLPAEMYNMDAAPYESVMLGQFSILRVGASWQNGRAKINDLALGFSRDGYHFDRPYREAIITVSEDSNAWNFENIQSVGGGCTIVGDKLYIYCSGRRQAGNSWISSTGVGFMRRDGFSSMDANDAQGQLTTRPVQFKGKYVFVNTACKDGELRVEVLDKDGKVIEPFTKENCIPVSVDKTLWPVAWKGAADLGKLSGKVVKFKFYLKKGSLYSFWVSPDENGASHGYVAGGGPGFTSNIDTVGRGSYQNK